MPRLTWLHLSDLHAFSPDYSWDSVSVLRSVTEDLLQLQDLYNIQPDLLFFTGDAAFGRQPAYTLDKQFDEAARILDSIRSLFKDRVPPERCFFVPGNHDIDRDAVSAAIQIWQDALKDPAQLAEIFEKKDVRNLRLREQVMARFDDYRAFLKRHEFDHCGPDHPAFIYAKTLEVNGVKVGIAGFNSSITCCKNDEKSRLWMAAGWQINRLLPEIDRCDLKIALIHHPDNWLHEYEDKLFRDLSLEVDFVLHGHEHNGWIDPPQPSFPLKHVRSAAAALYDRENLPNGYSVCEWDSDKREPTVYFREYSRPGRGFRTREIPKVTDDRGRWPKRQHPSSPESRPVPVGDVAQSNAVPHGPVAASLPNKHGYLIEEIISSTIISQDGDCKRVVELNQVTIEQPSLAQLGLSRVFLSSTTGYIDPGFVRANIRGHGSGAFRTAFVPTKQTELLLHFGRPLSVRDRFSIEYSWHSLNGFAMEERQYRRQYGANEMEELAHFPLLQPAQRLSLFVHFPASFFTTLNYDLRSSLSVQVFAVEADGVIQLGTRQYAMEEPLRAQVRFIRSLEIAFLDIPNPLVGFSYGLSWRVPPFPEPLPGVKPETNRETLGSLETMLLQHQTLPDRHLESCLQIFFQACYTLFKRYLLDPYEEDDAGWSGEVILDLMIFDSASRCLRIVSVYTFRDGIAFRQEPIKTPLPYGLGMGGKAYKINSPILWVKIPPEERTTPDPYVRLGEKDDHNVLLSIPLQNPADPRYVYAIVNLGSADPNCPLRRVAENREMPDILRDLTQVLSDEGLTVLSRRA